MYNMDEAGFNLSTPRRTRRVGRASSSSKSQSSLADDVHISVIATMSTTDSPVPPFVVYKGGHLLEEWLAVRDEDPKLIATVTDSGYSNGFTTKQWLTECFDPYTRNRAGTSRRLLFLDGLDSHAQVGFLEACWERNIVCLILPAHLSGVFQPLDVNFFNPLKLAYHKQIDDYQLESDASRVTKAFFCRWFQRAWASTANSRTILSAWAKSGLWPLSELVIRAQQMIPERQTHLRRSYLLQ